MPRRATAALATVAAVAIAGCTPTAALMTPPPTVTAPPGRTDEVLGGVTFASGGLSNAVAYGPWRVKGPGVDLVYAGDGAWRGTWGGAPATFTATQGLLRGPRGTLVTVDERDGALVIRGTWGERGVDVALTPRSLKARTDPGGCTLELAATGPGTLSGPVGCPGGPGRPATAATGTLLLQGESVLAPRVLLPQVAIAVLSVLP